MTRLATSPWRTPTQGACRSSTAANNGDGILDLDETWIYTCTVAIDDDTINLATVTGTPSIGDDVDDPANAAVDVGTRT